MLERLLKSISPERLTGAITVAIVAGLSIWIELKRSDELTLHIVGLMALYAVYATLFLINTSDKNLFSTQQIKLITLTTEYVMVCLTMLLSPFMFNAILLVIWASQLPFFISFKRAILSSPLWTGVPWLVYSLSWPNEHIWFTAFLFYTFNLFALVVMNSSWQAEQQKAVTDSINRELKAMQTLLREASKQQERLRISRDLHDVAGHHLTALSLQLQVAEHKLPAQYRSLLEPARDIAKALLSDIRQTVSNFRHQQPIDLNQTITSMLANLLPLQVELSLPTDVKVDDFNVATTLVRLIQESLTNSIRHGFASQVNIQLCQTDNQIEVNITDNGRSTDELSLGNGLKGLAERVEQVGGQVTFMPTHSGFSVSATLPLTSKELI